MHSRVWLFSVLLLCLCVAVAADDTTCSATKRCKNGCCNKSGNCGFGPDYCGTNCRSDCDRKSDCNPGFGAKWAKRDKCPLNVCCSKHGYCGTTKDFCGSKTVRRPKCDKDSGVPRVVGYFEGWAPSRACENFWPEQIPIGLYTHINFAFGTIDPKTFQVKADKPEDVKMYKRLMLLKEKDPDLKIYLAVGGWTFNDPGPTATTFSDIAASVPRQKAFMNSLMSFMSTHNFDGLDIDWEYPQDEDRSGREVDYANFPKFMGKLKTMMDGGNKGLTITLPASYWYLKYFDIKKLESTVDFFNIMSYDLHGSWDQGVEWTAPYLNAHTNLTEIELALDLLWRNDIDSNKVVLGLGFYGRAFTAATGSCMKPGCLFKDAGNAGKCSREKGVLLNSEIDAIIKERKLKPVLYQEEAVKVATWGNQWVSFDDEETLKMKSEYAQSRCLGGVMVWAISHDTKDAKYNKALAKAVDREVTSGSMNDNEQASEIKKIPNEQCRWTNCKEVCPKGWLAVARSDGSARKNELMLDETGCGGEGAHTFCCPATFKVPTCGWYGFKGGKCTKGDSCPSDMVEVGSNKMYCNKDQNYQSACCTTDVTSMKVYKTCEWGMYPNCDDQDECRNALGDLTKNFEMARSVSGSGGGECDVKKNPLGLNIPGNQFRKYCCNANNANLRFESCQWYRDLGPAPDPRPNGFCRSGCPPDRVRVALDTEIASCSGDDMGGMARCCKTSFNDVIEVENPKLDAYRSAMMEWIEDPTCPNPGSVFTRRADDLDDVVANATLPMELTERDVKIHDITAQLLLTYILARIGSEAMLAEMGSIWDSYVDESFEYLSRAHIKAWLGIEPQWQTDGPEETARRIICSPHSYNSRIAAIQGMNGKGQARWINCTYSICDVNGVCKDDADKAAERRRALLASRSTHLFSHHHHHHHQLHTRQAPDLRGVTIKDSAGNDAEVEFKYAPNDTPKKLAELKLASLEYTAEFLSPGDCSEWRLKESDTAWAGRDDFETEHPIDKSMMISFLEDVGKGKLRTGAKSLFGPVPIKFFQDIMVLGPDNFGWPEIPGNPDFDDGNLFNRIAECLGSKINNEGFVITHSELNYVKANLMQLHNPIAPNKWEEKARDEKDYVLGVIRATISMFDYMNTAGPGTPNVHNKIGNILNEIIDQILYAENLWESSNPGQKARLAQFFKEWLQDFYLQVTAKAKEFLRGIVGEMKTYWGNQAEDEATQVMEIIASLEPRINGLHIDTNWETPLLEPDSDSDTDMSG